MSTASSNSFRFRRLWKPALIAGTGGTGMVIWLEEVVEYVTEFMGVILLVLLGALICLFDHFVFKSRTPQMENKQSTTKGNKK